MKTNYVLIDYENVQVKSLALLKGDHFRVKVFLGPNNTRLPVDLVLAMQDLGDRAEYIVLETAGANALDFHIAYYIGQLSAVDPQGYFHIISRDTGFDPLIKHLKNRKVFSCRSVSIAEMPCLAGATPAPATSTSVAATGTPASAPPPVPAPAAPAPSSLGQAASPPPVSTPAVPDPDATSRVNGIALKGTPLAAPEKKSAPVRQSIEDLLQLAVADLVKRKASKPRTSKTLVSTIHAKCGKDTPASEVEGVFNALVARGYVRINGAKVSYSLPAETA